MYEAFQVKWTSRVFWSPGILYNFLIIIYPSKSRAVVVKKKSNSADYDDIFWKLHRLIKNTFHTRFCRRIVFFFYTIFLWFNKKHSIHRSSKFFYNMWLKFLHIFSTKFYRETGLIALLLGNWERFVFVNLPGEKKLCDKSRSTEVREVSSTWSEIPPVHNARK